MTAAPLRVLIARREALGEAFAAAPFAGAADLKDGLCATPLTGQLIAAIDARVDPGAWIGESAAMMSHQGAVAYAEIGPAGDGEGRAGAAWKGGALKYGGRSGIPGLIPGLPPAEGDPVGQALEAAFGLAAQNGKDAAEQAGLGAYASNEDILRALGRPPETRPAPKPKPREPGIVLRFEQDAALLEAATAAGGRAVLARQRGFRRHLPLLAGLAGGAAMLGLGLAAPLMGFRVDIIAGGLGILFGAVIFRLAMRMTRGEIDRLVLATPVMRAPLEVELRPEGVLARTELSETALTWDAVDAVIDLGAGPGGGLGLLAGAVVVPLPDRGLPEGLDRATLRNRIAGWRGRA